MSPVHPIIDDLTALRQERGLSLAQAAELAGISMPTLWKWEEGDTWPGLRALSAYAMSLGYAITLTPTGRRP